MGEERQTLRVADRQWPPNPVSGSELRKQADRRRHARMLASVVVAAAVLLAATTVVAPLLSENAERSALSEQSEASASTRIDAFGVSLALPAGWSQGIVKTTADYNQLCLDNESSGTVCGLVMRVTTHPARTMMHGLAVRSYLSPRRCHPSDPNSVQVTNTGAGELSATRYEARCNSRSPVTVVWTLDNGTVTLSSHGRELAAVSDHVFLSLRIPSSWPTPAADLSSVAPTSSGVGTDPNGD